MSGNINKNDVFGLQLQKQKSPLDAFKCCNNRTKILLTIAENDEEQDRRSRFAAIALICNAVAIYWSKIGKISTPVDLPYFFQTHFHVLHSKCLSPLECPSNLLAFCRGDFLKTRNFHCFRGFICSFEPYFVQSWIPASCCCAHICEFTGETANAIVFAVSDNPIIDRIPQHLNQYSDLWRPKYAPKTPQNRGFTPNPHVSNYISIFDIPLGNKNDTSVFGR